MEALEFFREMGRKGGKIGAKRRVETTTPAQRRKWAKKAAAASAKVRSAKAAERRAGKPQEGKAKGRAKGGSREQ